VVLQGSPPLKDGTVVAVEPVEAPVEPRNLGQRLKLFSGSAKGLPTDMARNHDHYLARPAQEMKTLFADTFFFSPSSTPATAHMSMRRPTSKTSTDNCDHRVVLTELADGMASADVKTLERQAGAPSRVYRMSGPGSGALGQLALPSTGPSSRRLHG